MLGNLSGPTLIVILFIVLLLFGAPKLPGLAKSLGQSMRILKKEVSSDKDASDASEGTGNSNGGNSGNVNPTSNGGASSNGGAPSNVNEAPETPAEKKPDN